MKKSIVIFLFIFLSSFLGDIGFASDVIIDNQIPDSIILEENKTKRITNTPFSSVKLMAESVAEEDIDISNQIYNNILKCDLDLFRLTDDGIKFINGWKDMTDIELDYVKDIAAIITEDCESTDDIIRTVAFYIAENVCYDYDYYYNSSKEYEEINHNAYDVLTNNSAVCLGYATAFDAIMQINDIPCILIYSPNHAWNMVYNGEEWILVDTTWMSNSILLDGTLKKSSKINEEWFDYTIDQANSNESHVISDADYCEFNDTIVSFPRYSFCDRFEIPYNVNRIEEYAFYGCSDVDLSFDGVFKAIGTGAFYNCCNFYGTVNLGDMTDISDFAFYECSNLNFKYNKGFENVGRAAFYDCNNFKGTINLKNINRLGDYAFFQCKSIDNVYIGNGIDTLLYGTFYGCSSIQNLVLDKNLKIIEDFVFSGCNKLKKIYYTGSKNEFYNIVVGKYNTAFVLTWCNINYKPSVNITVSGSTNKTFCVEYIGIPVGETIVYAEYDGDKIISFKTEQLTDKNTFTQLNNEAKKAKIFVLEDFLSLNPCVNINTFNL